MVIFIDNRSIKIVDGAQYNAEQIELRMHNLNLDKQARIKAQEIIHTYNNQTQRAVACSGLSLFSHQQIFRGGGFSSSASISNYYF